MFETLEGKIIRRHIPMCVLDEIKSIVTFAQGHRTQAIMIIYALIEMMKILGVITSEQAHSIESVLSPLAVATFAAKVGRIGDISAAVVETQQPK